MCKLCRGQSEIVLGQSGLNQNSQRYNKFYFLKSNLTHKLQCCLPGAPNSAKFRGGCRFDKGGVKNFYAIKYQLFRVSTLSD